MNKTKIDWCDSTWNPVTGCLRGCEYCYARRIARRFSHDVWNTVEDGIKHYIGIPMRNEYYKGGRIDPYPYGFDPTFYRYRLDEPQKSKKPQNIFVCSMADLFGEWVPDEWIIEVFKACATATQHRYLFLTKNPDRVYWDDEDGNDSVWKNAFNNISDESIEKLYMMFGASITSDNDSNLKKAYSNLNIDWVSIEPLLGEINRDFFSYTPQSPNSDDDIARWNWVVIGAETGNRKNKVVPQREWIDNIVECCRDTGTPVFMKESLRKIMGVDFVQEFPWEAERK